MNRLTFVRTLREAPENYLEVVSPLALRAFFTGYEASDPGVVPSIRELAMRLEGPEQADAFTKAYLRFGNREAVEKILQMLEEAFLAAGELPAPHEPIDDFVRFIVKAIADRRPAMVLGDSSLSSLANCVEGYLCGLAILGSEAGGLERATFGRFRVWLASRYSEPHAAWYKIIQVYGGPCDRGLDMFVAHWEEFERGEPA